MIAGSTVAHIGLISSLALASFWNIEKVQGKSAPVTFVATAAPPPPPAAAAPPPAPAAVMKPKPVVVKHETVQPSKPHPIDEPIVASPSTSGAGTDPSGTGTDSNGGPGGDPNGTPGGEGPPAPVVEVKPQNVAESVIAAALISGTRQIPLPLATKQAVVAQGRRQLTAAVKLCLDTHGVPARIDLVVSTGFPEADQRLRSEIAAWRYRPYVVNGIPIPVCTAIAFQYQIND